jgi:uncharacterized protein (TIGR02246 family)
MKFSTSSSIVLAAVLAAASQHAQAFAPSTTSSSSSRGLAFSIIGPAPSSSTSSSTSSTELGLFGLFKGAGSTKVKPQDAAVAEVATSTIKSTESPAPSDVTEDQIRNLFHLWNDALATGESSLVAKRYAKDAVLLPTVSDEPRMDAEGIRDYFDAFLKKQPQGEILNGRIKIGNGWAKDAGIYEFAMGAEGNARVKARYSFVYVWEDNQWKILHHHSSMMPEQVTPNNAPQLENKAQVQNLFHLWNDALDTLDADAVAKRYSKDAVLLPTVSDTPRTDHDGIKSYFVDFLEKKPQGTILESHVTMGPNWAKDVGIYEFTMRAQGNTKVKARYSFVYTYEDGQWKIAHHHSSAMPEGLMAAAAAAENAKDNPQVTPKEVQALFTKWNDALATLDSQKVAACYAPEAVLLPTVSDTPRTDPSSIKSYFSNFLQSQPQGVIVESHVTCGDEWCQDVGVYEFTMGSTGKKVKARYSFVYTLKDGEWKILHHHSSAMPEGLMAAAAACDEQQQQSSKAKPTKKRRTAKLMDMFKL